LLPILFLLRFRFKEVRVAHFAIPCPKYLTPFASILFD